MTYFEELTAMRRAAIERLGEELDAEGIELTLAPAEGAELTPEGEED